MTLPFFLMVHALFGLAMGRVFEAQLLKEGEILSPPLLQTAGPVTLVTGPLGIVLARYSGGWFFHGLFVGEGKVIFERYYLGWALLVMAAGLACSVGGFIYWAAMRSRNNDKAIKLLIIALGLFAALWTLLEFKNIFWVLGTQGTLLFFHPAGWISVSILLVLLAWERKCRKGRGPQESVPS